ncbi:MAG TPA: hypothetical protein GX692_03045 [Acholeplasmataceae bacterium]|jgi:putative protease|nr:hypothetical protein [Acholeplasmataceae bacterium]
MKLLADLKSITNISKYQADGLIFSDSEFSCAVESLFAFEEIEEIVRYCQKNKLISVLNIDRIIAEDELSFLFSKLEKFLELGIDYYIFGDFSILSYFRKRGEEGRLIYNPKTLITNSADAYLYKEMGIKVAISNELNFNDILAISKVGNGIFEIYGHHQIFYSKRPLLSSFSKHYNLNKNLDNTLLHLQEEKREALYPVYESKHGTFIYTSYRYALFLELPYLKDELLFGRINPTFIEEEEVIEIISLYKKALASTETEVKSLYEELIKINANIERGFLEKKSVLLKEEE